MASQNGVVASQLDCRARKAVALRAEARGAQEPNRSALQQGRGGCRDRDRSEFKNRTEQILFWCIHTAVRTWRGRGLEGVNLKCSSSCRASWPAIQSHSHTRHTSPIVSHTSHGHSHPTPHPRAAQPARAASLKLQRNRGIDHGMLLPPRAPCPSCPASSYFTPARAALAPGPAYGAPPGPFRSSPPVVAAYRRRMSTWTTSEHKLSSLGLTSRRLSLSCISPASLLSLSLVSRSLSLPPSLASLAFSRSSPFWWDSAGAHAAPAPLPAPCCCRTHRHPTHPSSRSGGTPEVAHMAGLV